MSPTSLVIYRVETDESFESIREKISNIDITETTENETELKTRTGRVENIADGIFYAPLYYQNEQYFKVDNQDTWMALDDSIGIGFIMSTNLVCFRPKNSGGDKIANKLNKILFGEEIKIRNHRFSEDFMLEFMGQNPNQTIIGYLNQLTFPNASSQSIIGPDIKKSQLYEQALNWGGRHGYLLLTLLSDGITIGLSKRKHSIIFYNKLSAEYMLQFVKDKILPLL